jgi:hypothetical protein
MTSRGGRRRVGESQMRQLFTREQFVLVNGAHTEELKQLAFFYSIFKYNIRNSLLQAKE